MAKWQSKKTGNSVAVNRGLRMKFWSHLELADHAVLHVGGHHHPIPGGVRQLSALGGDALGHGAPGSVVAHEAGVGARLELGDAGHGHTLVMAWNRGY